MIASTVNLFSCYQDYPEIKEMFKQLQPYHPTVNTDNDNCLYKIFVAKMPQHIFYDEWQESGTVQNRFFKTYKAKKINVPSDAKIFHYDELYKLANYIQMLTGHKAHIKEHGIKYKKHLAVDKKEIDKMYEDYLKEIGKWENI